MSNCHNRKLKMIYNTPPIRFEKISPYTDGQFTKEQLDIRRKREILKYSSPKNSSPSVQLTKSERFSQTIRGASNRRQRPQDFDALCANKNIMSNLAGIPGKPVALPLNNDVPLYNYSISTRNFGLLEQPDDSTFIFHPISSFQSNTSPLFGVLHVQKQFINSFLKVTLQIPYTIQNDTTSIENNIGFIVHFNGSPIVNPTNETISNDTETKVITISNISLIANKDFFYEMFLTLQTDNGSDVSIDTSQIIVLETN
jgi:hypothetical protein